MSLQPTSHFFRLDTNAPPPTIPPQLEAELDTTRTQLLDSNAEATAAALQLRSTEAARQAMEHGHQTQTERARDLQQRVESLSEVLEAERGARADEKRELQVRTAGGRAGRGLN